MLTLDFNHLEMTLTFLTNYTQIVSFQSYRQDLIVKGKQDRNLALNMALFWTESHSQIKRKVDGNDSTSLLSKRRFSSVMSWQFPRETASRSGRPVPGHQALWTRV